MNRDLRWGQGAGATSPTAPVLRTAQYHVPFSGFVIGLSRQVFATWTKNKGLASRVTAIIEYNTAVEARPYYSWTVAGWHQITVLVPRRRRGLCLLPLPSPFEVQKPILADTDDERTILPDNRSLRACLLSKKGTPTQVKNPRQ